MPHTRRLVAIVAFALATLACTGGPGDPPAPAAPADPPPPSFPAEPVALVDLPGEEHPTDLALLPGGAFAVSVSLLGYTPDGHAMSSGGVRFRSFDGGPGPRADVELEAQADASSVAPSPDGTRLAVARYDHVDILALDGGPDKTLPLHDAANTAERCSSPWQTVWSGGTLAVRCAIGAPVVLLDVATGACSFPLPRPEVGAPSPTILEIGVSPDGHTLAVLGSDDFADPPRTWLALRSLPEGALLHEFTLPDRYDDLAFSPDGTKIAVSHPYTGLRVLDVADGHELAKYTYTPDHGDKGSGDVAWSPDGTRIYRVGRRLGVTVHDASDAHVLGHLPAHPDEPAHPMPPPSDWPATLSSRNGTLAITPDGHHLLSIERADFGRAVRVWKLP